MPSKGREGWCMTQIKRTPKIEVMQCPLDPGLGIIDQVCTLFFPKYNDAMLLGKTTP